MIRRFERFRVFLLKNDAFGLSELKSTEIIESNLHKIQVMDDPTKCCFSQIIRKKERERENLLSTFLVNLQVKFSYIECHPS